MQSSPHPPSAGTSAALRTTCATRSPSPATTPGTTSPAEECATRMIGPVTPASSTSASTEATSSATDSVARSAGLPFLPGRSTANAGRASRGNSRSQNRAVDPPPCISRYVTADGSRGGLQLLVDDAPEPLREAVLGVRRSMGDQRGAVPIPVEELHHGITDRVA